MSVISQACMSSSICSGLRLPALPVCSGFVVSLGLELVCSILPALLDTESVASL